MPSVFGNPINVSVRSSLILTGTASTESGSFTNYGPIGLRVFLDQSVIAATSAGGGS